jgi:probable F420-dependent oxidoreductase
MRWGVTIPLDGLPLAAHREALAEAVRLGYTDAWTSEVDGTDSVTPAAVAAAWFPELNVGTAITNIYLRGPGLLAQTAAALAEIAPGRAHLGLGVSTKVIVERWNGHRLERPLSRMRATVDFLRTVLAGERASSEELGVQGFRLSRRVETPPAIYVAALRRAMLRLAGEIADGVITNWLAPGDVPRVVEAVREAARAAGRQPEAVKVACRIFVMPPLPDAAVRSVGRRLAAVYITAPVYRAFHEWLGRGDLIRPAVEAWEAGDRRTALELIPDRLLEELLVMGSRQECADKVLAYCRNGVDIPILQLITVGEGPQQQAEISLRMLRELARP